MAENLMAENKNGLSYGSIVHTPMGWRVTCEPFVKTRLKRIFPRAPQQAANHLTLTASAENSRELLWFLDRFPMSVDRMDLLEQLARQHVDTEQRLADLIAGHIAPTHVELAEPPRKYQSFAAEMLEIRGGYLLADDLGLGKTVSAICAMVKPGNLPVLVVCPAHLPRQWAKMIARFAPTLTTHILKKSTPYDLMPRMSRRRSAQAELIPASLPDVIITSYHKLRGWAETLAGVIKYVVYDEAQALRSPGTDIYRAASHVASKTPRRLGLSATPIMNYGNEFHHVISVLAPDALGSYSEFVREWCTPGDGGNHRLKDAKEFGSYLRREGLMLRRTRSEVGRELPELTKVVHEVEADSAALDAIRGNAVELAKIVLQHNEQFKGQRMQAAGEFDILMRQATGIAKCVAKGTRIVRFDGSVAAVEDLRIGDALMGPDSLPRRILATTSGTDEMYEVSSTSQLPLFKPYVVNGTHILALKHSGAIRHGDRFLFGPYVKDDHIEISVNEYLTKSAHFKRLVKGYKAGGVDFPKQATPVDPYFIGAWLGDGASDWPSITTMDAELREFIHEFAGLHGLTVEVQQQHRAAPTYNLYGPRRGTGDLQGKSRNPVLTALQRLGVIGNKHIPNVYMVNSRASRMELLAGLIDTDGSLNKSGGYTLSSKWEHLALQICRLAHSLGFRASCVPILAKCQTGEFPAYRVHISGAGLDEVPVKLPRKKAPPRRQIKDALVSGIAVRPVGVGEYYGFELDGDGLFLLEDFTVTHNSPYVIEFVKLLLESGEPVVLFGWHRAVYDIWLEAFSAHDPAMYTGSESPKQKDESVRRFITGETKLLIMSLRSGAGVDGLQGHCHAAVFGELDWAPGVLEQCGGRIHRDGQDDPCTLYFLVSQSGSDPIMAEVLGLKREQLEGVRNPDSALAERINTGENSIRRLARELLVRRGVALPSTEDANIIPLGLNSTADSDETQAEIPL